MLKNHLKYFAIILALIVPITSLAENIQEKPINSVPSFFSETKTLSIPLLQLHDSTKTNGSRLYSTEIKFNNDNDCSLSIERFESVPRKGNTTWYDKGFDKTLAEKLKTFMSSLVTNTQIGQPSVALLVEVDGKTWHGVQGLRRVNKKNELRSFDDGFRIGSLTKLFTVNVIMQLIDEGRVSLDDTLGKWFSSESWFTNMPNSEVITVKQLLNHQSGLYNYTNSNEFKEAMNNPLKKVHTPQEWLHIAFLQQAAFNPGDKFSYTNTGYILLGLLIQKELGMTYEEAIRKRILTPLKLTRTSVATDPGIPYPYTHGHSLTTNDVLYTFTKDVMPLAATAEEAKKNFPLTKISTYLDPSVSWSAGAVISNMYDMNTFIKSYVTGINHATGKPVWSDATKAKLLQMNHVIQKLPDGPSTWGFYESGNGIQQFRIPDNKDGDKYWGHFGQITGYDSGAFYNPKKKVSFIINGGSYDSGASKSKLINYNSVNLINILHEHVKSPISSPNAEPLAGTSFIVESPISDYVASSMIFESIKIGDDDATMIQDPQPIEDNKLIEETKSLWNIPDGKKLDDINIMSASGF